MRETKLYLHGTQSFKSQNVIFPFLWSLSLCDLLKKKYWCRQRNSFSGRRCVVIFCCKRGGVWWITTARIHNSCLLGVGCASGQSRNVVMGSGGWWGSCHCMCHWTGCQGKQWLVGGTQKALKLRICWFYLEKVKSEPALPRSQKWRLKQTREIRRAS